MIQDLRTGKSRPSKTDFTWFLERQHRDGHWELIHSKGKAAFDRNNKHRYCASDIDPAAMIAAEDGFGDWDADWVGILIGEYPIAGQIKPLGLPGWPKDVSAFLAQEYRDEMFHGSSHFTLGMMQDEVALKCAAPSGFPAQCLADRLAHLEYIVKQTLPPMFGRLRDPKEGRTYPEICDASNHERMAAAQHGSNLRPIGPDTVRVLTG